jgi:hypothetical protein
MQEIMKYADLAEKIANTTDHEGARIVSDYAEIVAMGLKCGLLYKRTLLPNQVGVHRKNRDRAMVSGRESAQIWDDVDRVGVAPDLFKDATSFEEPPNRENEIKFIKRCEVDEFLPIPNPGNIQVSSVACSHWNQALRQAQAGMVSIATTMQTNSKDCMT